MNINLLISPCKTRSSVYKRSHKIRSYGEHVQLVYSPLFSTTISKAIHLKLFIRHYSEKKNLVDLITKWTCKEGPNRERDRKALPAL